MAAVDEPLHQLDHLRHVPGGPRLVRRWQAAERLFRGDQLPLVTKGEGPPRLADQRGLDEDLVVDIGDVADESDLVTLILQPAAQDVDIDPVPDVPDMRRSLDRETAEIDRHPAWVERLESAHRPGRGVVQLQGHRAIVRRAAPEFRRCEVVPIASTR
jgi:hypothetical protein